MNAGGSVSSLYFCGRAPETGTTTCERNRCGAAAGYLCRETITLTHLPHGDGAEPESAGAWLAGWRLCAAHAAQWCSQHRVPMPTDEYLITWRDTAGALQGTSVESAAARLVALVAAAPDALRHDWDAGAELAGCHWLLVAVLDLASWPLTDGGLDLKQIGPRCLDALIGEVAAQNRARVLADATAGATFTH